MFEPQLVGVVPALLRPEWVIWHRLLGSAVADVPS
jgi:hypothetical protein